MAHSERRRGPEGPAAENGARGARRTVLLIVHTVASGQRLLDAARLLEDDPRVEVVFTQGPDVFGEGARAFLSGLGAAGTPWANATRTRYDLAVAAAHGGIHEVDAPLVVLPQEAGGLGAAGVVARRAGRAAGGAYGLDPRRLVHDGWLVPSAIALPHRDDRAALARACPEALPAAGVVGDPAYDGLVASLDRRPAYRAALGAGDGRKLVVVCSSWGRESLIGRRPGLWPRLLAELPEDEYQVVSLLHPHLWAGRGSWQARAWLAECRRRGLHLVAPEADWRGVLAAADWIIGDQGAATVYGAAAGVPVLLGCFHAAGVGPGSAAALLGETAPRLTGVGSLRRQLARAAEEFRPEPLRRVAERITSEPGRFGRNMRRLMYRLLRLGQPPTVPVPRPAVPPFLAK